MKIIICFGLILFILSTIFSQNQNDFYYSCVMHNTEKVKEYITKKSVDINHALSQDELISFLKYCADIEKTTYSDEVIEELEDFNLCPLTLSILDNGDFTQSSLSTFYCLISLQLSLSKVSEEIKWYFSSLSLKFPKPILPVWIKRIPVSDWSFDSIQSPSPI